MDRLTKTITQVETDMQEGLDNQPHSSSGWDDFSFPVTGLRINPSTSKPDYDYDEGEFLFDDASTETVVGKKITEHRFKVGTGVEWRPHIHWIQESAGVVKWQLEIKIVPANNAEGTFLTFLSTTDEFTYTSGTLHQITLFPTIDVSSLNTTAALVTVKISRLGGDAADTYVGDARFQSFDMHVPIDQPRGSRQEFVK